jgi:two-component system chemotaxis sensor kinase CheA
VRSLSGWASRTEAMDEEALALELMATYRAEARERLEAVTRLLLELEREPASPRTQERIEQMYREVHSLKGAARSVSQSAMEAAAHAYEDVLFAARDRDSAEELPLRSWYTHLDRLAALLEAGPERKAGTGEVAAARTTTDTTAVPTDESIRVTTRRLDRLMADVGTLLVSEQAQMQTFRELSQLTGRSWRKNAEGDSTEVTALRERITPVVQALRQQRIEVRRHLQTLDDDMRALRMTPVRSLFYSFERMVRDLAEGSGKLVRLEVSGEETELDRGVLDGLRDPLVHLIRNAIDHGVEPPAERRAAAKPEQGTLRLSASRQGSRVVITIEDDGRGIDLLAVRQQAARRQPVRPAANAVELLELLFQSGFSTREEVSEVSGRGLGLAIVRQGVQRLHGTATIARSEPGQGTAFQLTVPLTLATTRCLLLAASGNTYAVPLEAIHRTLAVTEAMAVQLQGQPAIPFEDRPARFFHLAALLHGSTVAASGRLPVLILDSRLGRVALAGDELRGEQELVVKQLPDGVPPTRCIAGAATLASGEVILVLDPSELVERALGTIAAVPGIRWNAAAAPAPARLRILVADDSLTTRTLERNILQAAGYEVAVAPDGAEAWRLLQSQPFALLVSDIEMPILDGFALTERIRADARLRSLPIVLVTAKAAREDRVRGLQAGADAYIAKREFQQSELLDTVDRLLGRTRMEAA